MMDYEVPAGPNHCTACKDRYKETNTPICTVHEDRLRQLKEERPDFEVVYAAESKKLYFLPRGHLPPGTRDGLGVPPSDKDPHGGWFNGIHYKPNSYAYGLFTERGYVKALILKSKVNAGLRWQDDDTVAVSYPPEPWPFDYEPEEDEL